MPFFANFSQIPSLAAWLASSQVWKSACDAKVSSGCSVAIGHPIVHSTFMPKRLITVLVAALALLIAGPAYAQRATATASPGQPPANASEAVKQIYTDYSDDGVIDVCKHTRGGSPAGAGHDRAAVRHRLSGLPRGLEGGHPALGQGALRVGHGDRHGDRHRDGLGHRDAGADHRIGHAAADRRRRRRRWARAARRRPNLARCRPRRTPTAAPTTAPPVATVPPATPAVPTPTPTAAIVTESNSGSLLIPGIILGVALLGGRRSSLSAFFFRRNPTWDHAMREAGYRVRGTWADFCDWLKLGR